MSITLTRALAFAPVLALAASVALAQEPAAGSDKERLERAKEEQASEKHAKESTEKSKTQSAEAAAEEQRLKELGVEDKDIPPEEKKGFFLGLEVYGASISGADRAVARDGDVVTTATTAEQLDTDAPPPAGDGLPDAFTIANERMLKLSYGSEVAPSIEVGYRRKSGGVFSVRYLGWSSNSSLSVTDTQTFATQDPALGDLILGGIDNQGFENTAASYAANPDAFERPYGSPRETVANQLHGADSVTASGKLDVHRWDLLFTRTALARKRFEVTYRLGLGIFEAKRSEAATFTWTSFDRSRVQLHALSVEDVSSSCDTSAAGPLVGIAGRIGLSKSRRWSVHLGLEVSGLKASHELAFRDAQQYTQDALPTPPVEVYQDVHAKGGGDFVTTIDMDAAIEYRFAQRFRVGLGYRRGWWFSALAEERFPSAASTASLQSDSVDLDVGGPYLHLGIFF